MSWCELFYSSLILEETIGECDQIVGLPTVHVKHIGDEKEKDSGLQLVLWISCSTLACNFEADQEVCVVTFWQIFRNYTTATAVLFCQ